MFYFDHYGFIVVYKLPNVKKTAVAAGSLTPAREAESPARKNRGRRRAEPGGHHPRQHGRLAESLPERGVQPDGGVPIRVESLECRASELLGLALRHDLTSYGAAYLDLALRLQLPIATQDAALREAALASGVGLWKPV